MNFMKLYYRYWGKAQPSEVGQEEFHLLVFHCLDVAAVGVKYMKQSPALLKAYCQLLNCTEEAFLSWAAFFIALHDLGKMSEAFQSQRPDLIFKLQARELNVGKPYNERHDSLGFWLWNNALINEGILKAIGIDNSIKTQRAIKCWMLAVTGHHGMPPKPDGHVDRFFLREDKRAAADFVQALSELLLTDEARSIPLRVGEDFEWISKTVSWWFSGVTVLADWLGSSTQFFPYKVEPQELSVYWEQAQTQAEEALKNSGVLPVTIEKGKSLQDFFPFIQVASPLQHWAATVNLPQTPQIYLLEDVTGAGKTEAAIMLAYRLMAQGSAEGFFIGLPTMATANAMYQRVADVYQKLFSGNAHLTLAHGFKKLVQEFAKSILPKDIPEQDPAQTDETATARCTSWLADHSKRALLATAGVGTVDQALLAVLHSKHQSLRLLGLFNKVLIIDEVHACDSYMLGVLEVLLEFHARADGSVILLSATLPCRMKEKLLAAYSKGRNQPAPILASSAYPLATRWHDKSVPLLEDALASRANVSRTVNVYYETDQNTVFSYIKEALRLGKCVGWIRNTVADAMAAYEGLSQTIEQEKIILFHARFSMQDRLQKEEQVLDYFGKKSTQQNRQGRLMIATQVAEQSLDVDFDILITDLAPIDRILQRAGRLQRHVRDAQGNLLSGDDATDQRGTPCLWVLGPEWTGEPKADWYGSVFKKGQYVYTHHGQLWLSAKVLQKGSFSMPVDARNMIEAVYSDVEIVPEALIKNGLKADGKAMMAATIADQNTLDVSRGYQRGDIGDWWSDVKTPSRLGDATMEIMLAKWVDGNLERWVDDAWPYSMVKVAAHLLASVDEPLGTQASAAYLRLKQSLPSQGKWCVLLPLSLGQDGIWHGQGRTSGNEKNGKKSELLTWLYDAKFGLRMQESDAASTTSD